VVPRYRRCAAPVLVARKDVDTLEVVKLFSKTVLSFGIKRQRMHSRYDVYSRAVLCLIWSPLSFESVSAFEWRSRQYHEIYRSHMIDSCDCVPVAHEIFVRSSFISWKTPATSVRRSNKQ